MELSSLDGTNGFIRYGVEYNDRSGYSVSSADANGDGTYDDIIIGAREADPSGSLSGETYVVFGKAGSWGATVKISDLLSP